MSSQKTEPRLATRLVKGGTSPAFEGGRAVNPPVVRASTVLFDSMDDMNNARRRRGTERMFTYGARGNPTGFALEDVVAHYAKAAPSVEGINETHPLALSDRERAALVAFLKTLGE